MKTFFNIQLYCKEYFGRHCFIADKTILIHDDAYNAVDVLAREFGQFANCWINDPPYGTTANSWDVVIPFEEYWYMANLVTKVKAPMIVFGSQPFTSGLLLSAQAWHRYCLVWNKNKCGSPGLAKYRPMKVHEDIVVFSRKPHNYYPIMEAGKPYVRDQTENKRYEGNRLNNHKYGLRAKNIVNNGTRYPTSILNFKRNFSAQQQIHPTQKPTNLLEWLIESYTKPEDIVIDITSGSTSLGVAAWNLDQPCICIEKESKYFRTGRAWLHALNTGRKWDPAAFRKKLLGEQDARRT
jgi:site-specific DNA-methyltransferase (adenine-specific)